MQTIDRLAQWCYRLNERIDRAMVALGRRLGLTTIDLLTSCVQRLSAHL